MSRSVVGDVATSISLDHFGADLSRRSQQVFEGGPQPERVDGVMLQKQEMVLGGGREVAMDPLLDNQGVAVADLAQPPDPEGPIG